MRNQVLYSIIGAAALFLVNACQKPVVNPPELKLPTTSFTDVSAAGDVVVVDYTLTNGVEGSEIKVDGDYDWARVTAIKSASIEVTVDPNETTEPRTAEFDVTYPGVTKDLSFSITQEAGEAPVVDAPVITLEPTSAEVPAAGESGGFNYEIANPVDDGAVTCSVLYPEGDAGGWITCDEVDAEGDGRINYEVSANEGDARAATIVVSYPGAEDVDFVISQAAAGGEAGYDYEYTFVTFLAGYFDNETIETADNYNFYMSDGAFEPGDVQYNFDLYTELASNGVLPAGTYTFDERTENYQPGTFSKFSTFGMAGEEADPVAFKGGTITISKDESGNYSFEAELTDANDKTHHVTYTGPMDFGGGDEPSVVTYEMKYVYSMIDTECYNTPNDEFMLTFSDLPFKDDWGGIADGSKSAVFDLYAADGTNGVLPEGTYYYDNSYSYDAETFVSGYLNGYDVSIVSGKVVVSKVDDVNYNIKAEVTGDDDVDYVITYTGPIGDTGGDDEPVDVTFDITVGNVTTDSFTYSIVPSDESAKYFHFATVKTTLVSGGIMSEDGAINEEMIEVLASQYITSMPDMFVHTGTLTDAPGMGVSAGDDVVVLCFALNSDNEKTTETTSYEFTMPLSYDFVMTSCNPTFYEGYGNGGEDNYYLLLSDKEIEDGYAQIGSNNYVLDIYVEAGSTSGRELPVGNYPLGVAQATAANTLGFDYTSATFISEDGLGRTDYSFTEGSVDISKNGDNYIIEGNFTDTEGNEHHFTYTGLVFPELPDVIECQATLGSAFYMTDTDGVMNVAMQFLDMVPDSEGYVHAPGTMITLDVYMPFNAEGIIATGTYEVSSNAGEEYTLTAGYSGWYGDSGCYLINSPDAETNFATYYITSGTIDVSGSPDMGLYNITCDFVTAEGIPVKCTYSGALPISQMPVIEDFDINLDGATGTAYHYGDYYNTGGSNWAFMLGPASSGDAVQVEIVSETSDVSAGIPSGTYVASSTNDSVQPGEFLPGYLSSTTIYGTNYIHFSGQSIDSYTPAVGGTIEIVNNGDGTYEMIFACEADHGNVWSGTWTGTLNISDQSTTYSTKSATASRHGYYTVKSLTAEEKVDIIKSSSFKAGKAQKAKVTVVR